MIYPHCDAKVLHAPGKCGFCDVHPDWQELRLLWGVNFTGESVAGKVACPSEWTRSLETIEKWPGNRPDPWVCSIHGQQGYPCTQCLASWTPTPVGNLYSKEKTLEYFKAAEEKVATPACNHDLDSPKKTLKATLAPRYGWCCTVCGGEWYP